METNIIIRYLYQYSITFCICLLGSFVKDVYDTIINKTTINIMKILISTVFTSFIMCEIYDLLNLSFPAYVFCSFFIGMWGFSLIQSSLNYKYVFIIFKNILSQISQPIFKGISKGMQEIEDDNIITMTDKKEDASEEENNNP